MIDLLIIIVAYNSPALLRSTLESVIAHTRSITYDLVVVDNASPDPDVQNVIHEFPEIRSIRADRNRGFAAANNLALLTGGLEARDLRPGVRGVHTQLSTPDPQPPSPRYVALLNPDTQLHTDALGALVRWLDEHPDVGAAGPQLLQPDGQPQPYSFGAAPSPRYLLPRLWSHIRGTYLHAWHGDEAIDVGWIAGTCMIVRREAIAQVGLLDEQLFLYWEDVDWGLRIKRVGWRIAFVPIIKITHYGGGSVGSHTSALYDRSFVRFYAKHYGGLRAAGLFWSLRLYRLLQSQLRARS